MGAWGPGSFENDTALDWAGDVHALEDLQRAFDELDDESEEDVDADQAQIVIAAADAIACMMGRPAPDTPDDLRQRLATFGNPAEDLIERAKFAVSRILGGSELMDLWAEAEDTTWNIAITDLIQRLNPNKEYTPVPDDEVEERARGPVGQCAFCNGDIARDELFGFDLHDYSDELSFTRGFWCHLKCLNEKLHPRHLIQHWKFDIS